MHIKNYGSKNPKRIVFWDRGGIDLGLSWMTPKYLINWSADLTNSTKFCSIQMLKKFMVSHSNLIMKKNVEK